MAAETIEALDRLRKETSPYKPTDVRRTKGSPSKETQQNISARKEELQAVIDSIVEQKKALGEQGRELVAQGKGETPEYDELVKKNKFLQRKILFMQDAIAEVKSGRRVFSESAQEAINEASGDKKREALKE